MRFNEKFASDDKHNSFTLTADGCIARTQLPDGQTRMEFEASDCVDSFGNSAMADERMMQNYLSVLSKHGKKIRKEQTVEEFISDNMDIIDQYER